MENDSILVEAKREYLGQMSMMMCPIMIQIFHDMYQEARRMSGNRKVLVMFQKLLKEVPNWSNAMSKQHADNITQRCSWFGDLLAAVFVSYVKIYSSVRLRSENKKLSLKLPTHEVFVQTCYNNAAENLYNDPYIFTEEMTEFERNKELAVRFCAAIENTVKQLIPIQHILQTYMSQIDDRNVDMEHTDERESEDPEIEEGTEEPEASADDSVEQLANPEAMDAPLPTPGEPMMPTEEPEEDPPGMPSGPISSVPFDTEVGVKTIPTGPAPQQAVLFPDAPEGRMKAKKSWL